MSRHPGRIAVRDGCGLEHMFFDGSDRRMLCLEDVFDSASFSRNGEKLAWDTKSIAILVSGVDAFNPITAPVPPGTNASPSLAPDGEEVAFLHSPRNDGKYDIWITSVTKPNAELVTNTSNVSDVAWSPTGDWLAYVQNWSDETLEGQLSLVRPNGDDPHTVIRSGDAPDWSPDGKKLVYVHNGSIWTVSSDGRAAARSRRSLARLVARR
jgi:Tol biopolymer transport system component